MRHQFHGQIVSLYADYGPDKLLQFLKSSDNYPMQEAMLICKKRKLYAEMIYLLGNLIIKNCYKKLLVYVHLSSVVLN